MKFYDFVLTKKEHIEFSMSNYDNSKMLIIDEFNIPSKQANIYWYKDIFTRHEKSFERLLKL